MEYAYLLPLTALTAVTSKARVIEWEAGKYWYHALSALLWTFFGVVPAADALPHSIMLASIIWLIGDGCGAVDFSLSKLVELPKSNLLSLIAIAGMCSIILISFVMRLPSMMMIMLSICYLLANIGVAGERTFWGCYVSFWLVLLLAR